MAAMSDEARNQCAGPFGAMYDFYIEREWLMRVIGRAVWGIDASVVYRCVEELGRAADGATVLDVPCGGGLALRALRASQDVRYVGVDISERMLERARTRARARGLHQAEFVPGDMLALPFADGTADLFLALSGLHMVGEPERAIAEIARCTKPGGRIVGTTFVREGSRRQRAMFGLGHRSGHALPPRASDVEAWFADAGIEEVALDPRRGLVGFSGRRTGG